VKLTIKPIVLSTATFGLMLGVAQNAQAVSLIPGVTATSTISSQPSPAWNLADAVNGKGLPGNTPSLTGNHVSSDTGNAWRSDVLSSSIGTGVTIPNGTITFNLNGSYNLGGFSFWNLGGTSSALTHQGIKNVTIQYSTDGINFTTIAGAPTSFAQGAFSVVGAPTAQSVQNFSFASVAATHVRFTNLSNFGGLTSGVNDRIGFSEIQFQGTKIPEPSASVALLAFGLAGVGLRKRV